MSELATIYAALADLEVTATISGSPVAVPVIDLAALPDSLDSWRGPVRMITPAGARAAGNLDRARTFGRAGAGAVLQVDWVLQDLFFFRGADAGMGLIDLAPVLISYAGAYLSAVAQLRTARYSVTGITFPAIGGFEWPAGSGRQYDGVIAEVTIREII